MSYIKLEYPILVQNTPTNDKPNYHLKPLFVPSPVVSDRRFEAATRKLRDALANRLKGFELNTENREQLLWYAFNPVLNFSTPTFRFSIGRQYFDGPVSIAEFELKGMTLILGHIIPVSTSQIIKSKLTQTRFIHSYNMPQFAPKIRVPP